MTCSSFATTAAGATSAPTRSTPTCRRRPARSSRPKDFRTWHGTVLAAVELAREGAPSSKRGAERAIRAAVKRVAERLGNTPAVCRSSYIDPSILDQFRDGKTIELPKLAPEGAVTPRQQGRIERRVLELIR